MTGLVDYQGFCGFSVAPKVPSAQVQLGNPPEAKGAKGEGEEDNDEEGFRRIAPGEVVKKMQDGWAPYVLDVRCGTRSCRV